MPQMLNHMDVETSYETHRENVETHREIVAIDWGTVAVYTCEANCSGDDYVKEFAFVQNFSHEKN